MKNEKGLITAEDLLEEVIEKLNKQEELLKKLHEEAKNASNNDFDFIDNHDLQKRLHITDRTALKLRKKGKLKYYKVDGKIFYKKADVDEMIEKGVKPA